MEYIIKPKIPRQIFRKPYNNGIKTGILIGFGVAWMIKSLLFGDGDVIVAIGVLVLGVLDYVKENYNSNKGIEET